MSSRPPELFAFRDPKLYQTLCVIAKPLLLSIMVSLSLSQDHYMFCYEVLADYVEKMEACHNFKTLM